LSLLLSLSPDGRALIVVNGMFYVVALDGSGPVLLSTEFGDTAHWKPDGSKIAFSQRFVDGDIHVIEADGSNARNITNTPAEVEGFPSWAPQGNKLLITRTGDVLVIDETGSSSRNLSVSPADDSQPVWPADAQTVVYVSDRDGNQELYRVPTDGGASANLTNQASDDYMARTRPRP
jgi:TolB protein